jgi:hypothetical protein
MPRSWIVSIVLSISLVGCAGWQGESKLPFPTSPKLTFIRSDAPNGLPQYCLTREGASDLSAFFDGLEAFKRAFTR